jgi:UDP-N-acetylglucosamine--N-acetylmuramyl-(pentapeptide) pyrophosphoryl-undecaprenol N-acetylglucosamine transferase
MTFVIAAAGTGGHVFPALAVARALEARGVAREEVVFFGGTRIAAKAVPAAGYEFVGFELARLERAATWRNLRIPFVVARTSRAMASEAARRRARIILGMSGYVTVPAARAARRCGVPFFLQEQNAAPGLAARFAARYARATFLGLPGRSQRLPRSEITGNPLQEPLAGFDRSALREEARARYGLEAPGPVLGVMGGSLGARVLNRAVPDLVAGWGEDPLSIVHLAGPEQVGDVAGDAADAPLPWRCLPFEDRMDLFFAAADLVLCRAGAMTVSELAATGTPAVLVPLRRVGQHHNAEALAAAGGAVVVDEADPARIPAAVSALLHDPDRRASLAAGAEAAARPDAAGRIADRLLEEAR